MEELIPSSSLIPASSSLDSDRASIASTSRVLTDGTTIQNSSTQIKSPPPLDQLIKQGLAISNTPLFENRLLPSHPINKPISTSSSRTNSPSRPPSFLDDINKKSLSTTSTSPSTNTMLSRPLPSTPVHLSTSLPPTLSPTPVTSATIFDSPKVTPRLPTTPIASLLRRNYTYFASLLQEPEAKWRAVSDYHGVSVSQMISIDPTVTIYRAQGTFVNIGGSGMWDIFAVIGNPGARAHWDKSFDAAVLLDELDSASLWHLSSKGTWPVSPRDTTIIQMAYQSPCSIHLLSFSSDDLNLFPSLPPPVLPTIRSQVDLSGWVVEALSPTTTRITVLDQSDPKGWSNKSWTPTDLVNQLAGVGEFAIKYGGPPILVSLVGAKKTASSYEHSKRIFKTEYKPLPSSPTTSIEPLPLSPTNLIGASLRCDLNVWAASLVIVIEPPPLRISCVTRHRLSESGGTWITIEHDKSVIGDGVISITVRRGGDGREKGTISVNGSDIPVVVETLQEDEIEQLTKKKRVKHVPVPLDQSSWTPGSQSSPSQSQTSSPLPAHFSRNLASKLVSPPSPLLQEVDSKLAAKVKLPLDPPANALDALSWLQTFHAGQGPDLADPAPGWTTVTERGGVIVRKKIVAGVSDVLPVYRGDKIVQGLSADEIASIVSSVGCRAAWDERIQTAIPLANYGYGISTAAFTTKATFPFKGRSFHVASANAAVQIPSASETTSTILFCASASYSTGDQFDDTKINPAGLLPGDVILEGWILETLDPYASSMLAIPSTRLSYFSCVDNSSYVPLALNSVLNANLSRIINSVENLGKSAAPLPRLRNSDNVLQIEGPLSDDGDHSYVWNLSNKVDSSVLLLSSDFSLKDSTFRALYRISAKATATIKPSGLSLSRPPSAISSTLLKSELPRSASLTFYPPISSPSLQTPSTAELTRKTSMNSLKPPRSNSPPASTKTTEDLIVAELIIDLKQYPNGFSIIASSSLLTAAGEIISLEPLRSLAARQIPLKATVHDAPLPAIVSASLNSWKRHNYLVRIFIPISETIKDPLRELKSSKTEWQKSLELFGGVVEVRIIPFGKEGEGKEVVVNFNGEDLVIEKESRVGLPRPDEEDWQSRGAKISRIPRRIGLESDSVLPIELRQPIAVATRLLATPVNNLTEELEVFPDPKSPGSSTPADVGALSPVMSSRPVPNQKDSDRIESPKAPLLGILGSYPLPQLASNFTMTFPITNDPTTATRRTYTLSFVFIMCIIFFLLGSFLRSLFSPTDFLLRSYSSTSNSLNGNGEVGGNEGIEKVLLQAFELQKNWRVAVRILEVRLGWGWDLVIAAVESE